MAPGKEKRAYKAAVEHMLRDFRPKDEINDGMRGTRPSSVELVKGLLRNRDGQGPEEKCLLPTKYLF